MRFVIIGGGCYGTFYTRQLLRAADEGAIEKPEILVVDHGSQPEVVGLARDERVQVVSADWDDFFDHYFAARAGSDDDQIVPPPFTPHVALRWLLRALPKAGAMKWSIEPFRSLPQTPFVQQSDNGTLNASHADWLCPVHCIEPDTCPHTRGPRDWDMAETARTFARTLAAAGQPVSQVHVFRCLHLTHGVGCYPAGDLVRAFTEMRTLFPPAGEAVYALVATVSHCHGTLHLLKGEAGTDTVSRAEH